MLVILDTGPFHDNPHASGEIFGLLGDAAAEEIVELLVPEVVIQEVVKQFGERLEKAQNGIKAEGREIRDLVGSFEDPTLLDISEAIEAFEKKLRDRLEALHATVLPLPDLGLQDMLDRDKANRKPFTGGRGFRDALIWESVLEHLAEHPSDFTLITGNRNDFGVKNSDGLHPHLQEDISDISDEINGTVVGTLKEYVDSKIKPNLKSVEDLKTSLEEDKYPHFTLTKVIEEHLDELQYKELDRHPRLGFDLDEPITVESADGVENVVIESALKLHRGAIFVEGDFQCTATIEGYIYKSDAYGLPDENKRVHITDWNWNEWYVAAEISDVPLVIEFRLTFNKSSGEIEAFEFGDVSAEE